MAAFTNVMKSLENYSSMSIDFAISGASISFFLLIGMFGVNVKIGLLTLICLTLIWFCIYLITTGSPGTLPCILPMTLTATYKAI